MAGMADMLENWRNWKGRGDWDIGRNIDIMTMFDPDAADFVEGSSLGTGSHGLSGMVGAIKASHGSPHLFDKFDMSKIGTGEGAQAYGHGLYYAQGFDSPVAKQYRDALSSGELRLKGGGEYDPSNPSHMAAAELMGYGGDRAKAISDIQQSIQELGKIKADWRDKAIQEKQSVIDLINKGSLPELEDVSHGHLYNVSLEWPDAAREAADPLGEHHLLDWDNAPSQDQIDKIMQIPFYEKWQRENPSRDVVGYTRKWLSEPDTRFRDIYEQIGSGLSNGSGSKIASPMAAKALRDAGFPGIKYLDQGSRGAGQGTSNYVIFDDQIPRILTRNGLAGMVER